MSEPRRHVLIWVAPEFLKSSGMIQLFTEASIFCLPRTIWTSTSIPRKRLAALP